MTLGSLKLQYFGSTSLIFHDVHKETMLLTYLLLPYIYSIFWKMVERMIKLNKWKVTIRFKFVYFAWRFFKKSHALGVMFQLTCNYIWTNQMIIDVCKNICEYKEVLNNISKTLSRASISNRVQVWLGHPIWNKKKTPRTSQIYLFLCKI